MRTGQQRPRLNARSVGIGMAGLLVSGLAAVAGPSIASAQTGDGGHMSEHMSEMPMAEMPMSETHHHPAHIDLTRVFGEGVGQDLLPTRGH